MSRNHEVWRKMPLHRAVLEIIISKPEGITESKLVEILKREYDIEVAISELYNVLMKYELAGLVQVEYVGKEFLIKLTLQAYQQFSSQVHNKEV
ncbi:MAG: ArsR family transcriptional regulator [Desulfurococcaceae archaeon]